MASEWLLRLVSMAFAKPEAAHLPEYRLHGLGCSWLWVQTLVL